MDEKCFPSYMPPGMSSSVLIFQPGSRHLYFGRATDPEPHSILHIIARRRKSSAVYCNTIVPTRKLEEQLPPEVESARLQLSVILQSALSREAKDGIGNNNNGSQKHISTNIEAISFANKNAKRQYSSGTTVPFPGISKEFQSMEYVVGEDVMKIVPNMEYNIHCPWRRGQLNLHKNLGGSISSVMTDMEDIWRWCITKRLAIPVDDLKNYKAVVIVPVMFDRVHAKEIMNLLMQRLGFQSAFLIQDHICASFGSGIACATVVDVGDQKISVSCVEDAVSYPQSRLELKYGSGDLTVALCSQLQLISFPILFDLSSQWDLEYVNLLKEKNCHLDLKNWDSVQKRTATLVWDKPGEIVCEYKVHFGDELMIVPLGYFNPDLLRGSTGRNVVVTYGPQPSVSDDPFDRSYLNDNMKKSGTKETDEEGVESHVKESKVEASSKQSFDLPLSIDQALIQSIESCSVPDELKQRFYSCIILVGGGSKITGLSEWLASRMRVLIPKKHMTATYEQPRIIQSARNGNPSTTTWKGAALLSSLETSKELWINGKEWNTLGSRILREKCLFQF